MRTKIVRFITLILLVPLLFTGCWDSWDVNKRNIITATLLDYKDDEYIFYMELASVQKNKSGGESAMGGPGSQAGGSLSQVAILTAGGKTLSEAREEIESKADNPIYLSAVRSIIISENFAQEGIEPWMNRIKEIREYRQTMRCVTSACDPEKLLKSATENAPSVGFAIDQMFENLANYGQVLHISSEDILEKLVEEYTCFLIPDIDLVQEKITFTGYTVFKDDRRIGFIPKADANGIVFMFNPHARFLYNVPYGDTFATIEVKVANKEIKPYYSEGKIYFTLNFGFEANFLYADKNITFDDNAQTELKKTLEELLLKDLADTVKRSQQQFKSDYLEFNDAFRIAYPKEYGSMDWSQEYPKAQTHIILETNLSSAVSMDYEQPVKK